MHVVLQGDGQPVHEGGAWRDGVAVKDLAALLLGNEDALLRKLSAQTLLLSFLGGGVEGAAGVGMEIKWGWRDDDALLRKLGAQTLLLSFLGQ